MSVYAQYLARYVPLQAKRSPDEEARIPFSTAPRENDVCFPTKRCFQDRSQVGNQSIHALLRPNQEKYNRAESRQQRLRICSAIMRVVHSSTPPGRFLGARYEKGELSWIVLKDKDVILRLNKMMRRKNSNAALSSVGGGYRRVGDTNFGVNRKPLFSPCGFDDRTASTSGFESIISSPLHKDLTAEGSFAELLAAQQGYLDELLVKEGISLDQELHSLTRNM